MRRHSKSFLILRVRLGDKRRGDVGPAASSAVRSQGIASLEDVAFVVLETNGTFSVIVDAKGSCSALHDVGIAAPGDSQNAATRGARRQSSTRQNAAFR